MAVFLTLCLTLLALGLPVGDSLAILFKGGLANKFGLSRTLVNATPLLLAGLGVIVAWRAGMYSIGGEGQFICGGIAGALLFAVMPGAPPLLLLAASVVGGAALAVLVAWLQIRRGVQLVISTILLNFVALQLLEWVSAGPLRDPGGGVPMTKRLPDTQMLLRWDRQIDLHFGVPLAVTIAILVFLFLYRTTYGFSLRFVGQNPVAAEVNRLPVSRIQLGAMALSGALCGLAGGVEYAGMAGQLGASFSQNWGFLAIPVAILGGLHPLGVVVSALAFGMLIAGTDQLARTGGAQSSIVAIIQGVSMLLVIAFAELNRRRQMREGAA
ncbi:MAG: ABC transporter permease [Chthonomonas sp.]|nr:ABC transporter permease [Chthonomonas sp.]